MKRLIALACFSAWLFANETIEQLLLDLYIKNYQVIDAIPDDFPMISLDEVEFMGAVEATNVDMVVVRLYPNGDNAQPQWHDELVDLGWTTPGTLHSRRGFLPEVREAIEPLFGRFCHPDGDWSFTIRTSRDKQGTFAYLSHSKQTGLCDQSQRRAAKEHQDYFSQVPMLHAPSGAEVFSLGSSSGVSQRVLRARLTTDLSAAEIIGHYNRELASEGWKLLERSGRQDIYWSMLSFQDNEDHPWTGTLLLSHADNGKWFISFTMLR